VITLVLGGCRSGKSVVAERIAARLPEPVHFLATGTPADADMAARVARHQARRSPTWRTVEVGSQLCAALERLEGTVLVDALGTWVAAHPDFAVDTSRLCRTLAVRKGDAVVVSDEVGLGVHPASDVGRRFRDAMGELNQAVASVADQVLLVVAGRTLRLDELGPVEPSPRP
jgi:adenosyl cobinamide kinase/adenosyl cobinamide phosphate guanylyltransferase